MRLEFVKTFIDSTTHLFREVVCADAEVASIKMRPSPVASGEVMAIIGLMGDAQGRVIFDMDSPTAIRLAECMIGEPVEGLTPMVRSAMAELASMATGKAISEINNRGVSLKMSPPTVISGANISYDHCLETLVAPITTAYGEVRVNITIQDLK
ncbi:MAG: chemotaxis protein CheX [Acidobacteriota bacterium]